MTVIKRKNNNIEVIGKSDIDFQLWMELDHARSALSRARELELAQFDLTLEQAGVLYTLLEKGGSTANTEIADEMIRQYNSVTTLVNRMEKLGLVKKEKTSSNRKYIVSITEKGRNMYQRATDKSIHMGFSDLSPEEKNQLFSFLTQVVKKTRNILGMDSKLPFLQ